jgi:hypothetical protein
MYHVLQMSRQQLVEFREFCPCAEVRSVLPPRSLVYYILYLYTHPMACSARCCALGVEELLMSHVRAAIQGGCGGCVYYACIDTAQPDGQCSAHQGLHCSCTARCFGRQLALPWHTACILSRSTPAAVIDSYII